MKMKKLAVKVTLAVYIGFLLFTSYLAYSIISFSNKNELVRTDAAIVLGAAAWGEKPSPVLKERINHSIELYRKGYVKKIIFTGGFGEGATYSESEVSKKYAIDKGIPDQDIFIEKKSKITEENLLYAHKVAKRYNLKSFTIVSDPLHMKRAIVIAHSFGMDVYSSPTQTSAYKSFKSESNFFIRELFFLEGYIVTYPFRKL
ncbi:YdcF family protein [Priestia aryabhattai]